MDPKRQVFPYVLHSMCLVLIAVVSATSVVIRRASAARNIAAAIVAEVHQHLCCILVDMKKKQLPGTKGVILIFPHFLGMISMKFKSDQVPLNWINAWHLTLTSKNCQDLKTSLKLTRVYINLHTP